MSSQNTELPWNYTSPLTRKFVSGAIAGLFCDFCMFPFDTIRARILISYEATVKNSIGSVGSPVSTHHYKGVVDAINSIVRSEGFVAFYQGFPVTLCLTMPAHGVYFLSYETSKRVFGSLRFLNDKQAPFPSHIIHGTSGAVAEIVGSSIWVPMEIIKNRQQIVRSFAGRHTHHSSVFSIIRNIKRNDGLQGFFRGYLLNLATFGPMTVSYFTLYELFKSHFLKYLNELHSPEITALPFYLTVACAFSAGSFSAALTTPLDTVKTRMMVKDPSLHTRHLVAAFREIFLREGCYPFYRGVAARVVWAAPGNALTMVAYEQLKRMFALNAISTTTENDI
eukprot:GCRY01006733.1.p1 GENE.GCRY01006733.1~~GCRY01006733.1.p1  ORF type:complete len:366 (-),score=8.63 GCRY01006733.1:317-1327(-)